MTERAVPLMDPTKEPPLTPLMVTPEVAVTVSAVMP